MNTRFDELLRHVPDEPRWVETRAALLRATGRLFGTFEESGGVVFVDDWSPTAAMIGKPDARAFEQARSFMRTETELMVQSDQEEHARAMLPNWRLHAAILHVRHDDLACAALRHDPDIIIFPEMNDDIRAQFPSPLQQELRHASMAAAKRCGGAFVSICSAGAMTESWWDVGVDTLEPYRRCGYATECFHALDAHLRERGLQPMWGALTTNIPSLNMARSLGFEPAQPINWMIPPGAPDPALHFAKADESSAVTPHDSGRS